jgi:hypothetical protein
VLLGFATNSHLLWVIGGALMLVGLRVWADKFRASRNDAERAGQGLAIVAVCAALIAVGIVVGDAMTPDYGR